MYTCLFDVPGLSCWIGLSKGNCLQTVLASGMCSLQRYHSQSQSCFNVHLREQNQKCQGCLFFIPLCRYPPPLPPGTLVKQQRRMGKSKREEKPASGQDVTESHAQLDVRLSQVPSASPRWLACPNYQRFTTTNYQRLSSCRAPQSCWPHQV